MQFTSPTIDKIVESCVNADGIVPYVFSDNIKEFCTNPENIVTCLNSELSNYGFKASVSPDKTVIYVDDAVKSQIINILSAQTATPYITPNHVERIQEIAEVIQEKNIPVIWKLEGIKRSYYLAKQYTFNGVSLYHLLNIKNAAAAAATVSPSGAATMSIPAAIAISYAGFLFFSTIESFIPNGPVKTVVKGAKVVTAFPIAITEAVTNGIFGSIEARLIKDTLPINITSCYGLLEGPKLSELKGIRGKVADYLIKIAGIIRNNK
jgi:hypothetical protein